MRAIRKEFMRQYSQAMPCHAMPCHVAKVPKMLLQNIYCTRLNEEAASSNGTVAKLMNVLLKLLLPVEKSLLSIAGDSTAIGFVRDRSRSFAIARKQRA